MNYPPITPSIKKFIDDSVATIICSGLFVMNKFSDAISLVLNDANDEIVFEFDFEECRMSSQNLKDALDHLRSLEIKIRSLNLNWKPLVADNNEDDVKTVEALVCFLKKHHINELSMEACGICGEEFAKIAPFLHDVKHLHLQLNHIFYFQDEVVNNGIAFLHDLFKESLLEWVSFSDNKIPKGVLNYIIDNLPSSISTIHISNTNISGSDIQKIEKLIEKENIKFLSVKDNHLTEDELNQLQEIGNNNDVEVTISL